MSNNNIKSLHKGIFSNLSSLKRLRLDNNKLKALPEGIFSNLKKLKFLRLINNPLPEDWADNYEKSQIGQLSNKIDNYQQSLENTRGRIAEEKSERMDKLEKLIQRMDRVTMKRMASYVNLTDDELFKWLMDLPQDYGFRLEGDEVVFSADDIEDHIDDLMASFRKFEDEKIGKN